MMALLLVVVALTLSVVNADGMLSLEFKKRAVTQVGDCSNSNPCSSSQTCCDTVQGEGCCPQANACCCPDEKHCCPTGKCQCSGSCPGPNCVCTNCELNGGQCESK